MLNSGANAPRAALVDPGTNPQTGAPNAPPPSGVSTSGTAPQQASGGVAGLQMRMAIQKAQQESQNNASEQGLRNAQTQNLQNETSLRAGSTNAENALKKSQTNYYNQRAGADAQELAKEKAQQLALKNADTMPRLEKDIDSAYGKGTTSGFFNSIVSSGVDPGTLRGRIEKQNGEDVWTPDPKGPLITPEPPKPTQAWMNNPLGIGAGPGKMSTVTSTPASMPFAAFQGYMGRYQNIQNATNGMYVPPGSNVPGSGGGGGAAAPTGNQTVATVQTQADIDALPPGAPFKGPDGVIRTK
jgi:hypothetical protein